MLCTHGTEHPEQMVTAGGERPTRGSLERRLALLKRSVVVVAVGSFAAVASLAAERTAAHGASTQPQTNHVNPYQGGGDDYFGSSPYGDDSGSSGSLGSGSGAPPAAGSHAS
ncbi:MAG TPA: hypothetical protein VN615_07990 [Gaiellales bacterium]|nr:hypothetical protein [Gaiellales bacterium]